MINLKLKKTLHSSSGKMLLDFNLNIEPGTFLTLYGKSGAGKTSVLRMLAGLMKPDQGKINVNNTIWFDTDKKINLSPQNRRAGLVFQDYALFPNMTVRENLEFALLKNQDNKIIEELIEIVELEEFSNRKPATLSGGQQQRVALARSLVQKPDVLMLDEPLSALDAEMRFKLQEYILKLHREFKLTTILVSHDYTEILKMSDRVIKMELGSIVEDGQAHQIFNQKNTAEGQLEFTGTISTIKENGDILNLQIKTETMSFQIEVLKNNYPGLKEGDRIQMNAVISKIKIEPA